MVFYSRCHHFRRKLTITCPERDKQGVRTALWKGMWHCSFPEVEFWHTENTTDSFSLWVIYSEYGVDSCMDSLVTVSICDTGTEAEWRKESMIVGMILLSAWRWDSCWRWGSCWRWWTRKPEWTQDLGNGAEFLKPPSRPTSGIYSEGCMSSVFKYLHWDFFYWQNHLHRVHRDEL